MTSYVYKNPYTGHTYQVVVGSYTWSQASTAAALLSLHGQSGYLATITSSPEQLLLQNYLNANVISTPGIFLGGSDSAVEGQWRWVSGPESGTQFWSGNATGQSVGGSYSNWDSGSSPPQPNTDASAATEDYLWVTVDANWNNLTRYKWGDSPAGEQASYLVEYNTVLDVARQGWTFTGLGRYLSGTDSNLPTSNQARTLEVWLKTSHSGSMQSVAEWGNSSVPGGRFGLLVTADGHPYFVGQSADLVSSSVINDGQWHQVSVTYNGTVVSIYVDGVLSVSSTGASPGFEAYTFSNLNTTSQVLRIGQSAHSEKFVGEIQSVAVWSKALSASEIVEAAQGASLSDVNLVSYYALSGMSASATSVVDAVNAATSLTVVGVNTAPTGSVTISGTATQGQTLTAANTLADADGLGTISYQWKADGVNISGATGSTLTLAQAQVGKAISVVASYTDVGSTAESVASSATSSVANVNDSPTGSVTISGTATQGQTLTAANTLADPDGLGTIGYQWKADGVNISGATGSTLTLAQAQVGKAISVVASYTDVGSTAESVASSATSSVANVNDSPTGSVTISGTATQGQTLTAANTLADPDGLGTIGYQWKADGVNISGATGSTLTLAQAQVGKAISVTASYTDLSSTAESVSSSATSSVANVNDSPTGSVTVSGMATQGQTLTAANTLADADGLGTIGYQWKADGVNISGATSSTLTLAQAQVGKAITVTASYTDGGNTTESVTSSATSSVTNVNDSPTGSVTIIGTSAQGQTLTASNTLADADGLGTISYQWKADGVNISGATSSTLTLAQAQVGKAITVVANYTDLGGTAESVTSSATTAVANLNDAPTGKVTISGTSKQGETLTAANTLIDADGLGAISYQWIADGVIISGATSSTLTLNKAQVGKVISVVASYTDLGEKAESVTSSATSAVADVNDAPTGSVTISGTATQGQTLTASNTLADANGLGTIEYQWKADGVSINGATSSTLTLAQAQVGKVISVSASYIDLGGTPESVTSNVTSLVQILSTGASLTGQIYQWKSHTLLSGAEISLAGLSSPVLPNNAKPLYELKNIEHNSATGVVQVGLWMNLNASIKNFDLNLKNEEGQALSFTASTTVFPTGWAVQANPDSTGGLSVAGFGDTAMTSTSVQLGTVSFKLNSGSKNTQINFLEGSVGGVTEVKQQTLTPYAANVKQELSVTGADGKYTINSLDATTYSLDASKSLTALETGSAISSADALAALKIAVGRNPNLDGAAISPYQLIAADVNQDGKVTSADALAILKMAVKRTDAPTREWLFVNESQDFWDEAANGGQGGLTISRTNVTWNKDLQATVSKDTTVNLLAVLKGDVNGSWTGPATGTQSLPNSYFLDLVGKGLGPLSTWGVVMA